MNDTIRLRILLGLAALSLAAPQCAADMDAFHDKGVARPLRLKVDIYVFRGADITGATALSGQGNGPLPADGHWAVVAPPSVLKLGGDTLTIQGDEPSWDSPKGLPAKLNLVSKVEGALQPDVPATVVIGENTQYLEKQPDGSFRLRELAAGAPGSAHCDLAFSAREADDSDKGLRITCSPEIVAIQSREPIPGLDFDVGKPVLKSSRDSFSFNARPGEWSCLYNRSPSGGDYGLLVLVNVSGGTPAPLVQIPRAKIDVTAGDTGWRQGIKIFDFAQLDHPPIPTYRPKPIYPGDMRFSGLSGQVVVEFIVDTNGTVRDAFAVSGPNHSFEKNAVQAVLKWKFKPGRKDGQAVDSRVQVLVDFKLKSDG